MELYTNNKLNMKEFSSRLKYWTEKASAAPTMHEAQWPISVLKLLSEILERDLKQHAEQPNR
jgi:hypothetical protein